MDGVKYKSVPPGTNKYHGPLVTQEGNSRPAPADKRNRYKLKPIILQLSLADYGDLLKMWQYAVSLSHTHTALR